MVKTLARLASAVLSRQAEPKVAGLYGDLLTLYAAAQIVHHIEQSPWLGRIRLRKCLEAITPPTGYRSFYVSVRSCLDADVFVMHGTVGDYLKAVNFIYRYLQRRQGEAVRLVCGNAGFYYLPYHHRFIEIANVAGALVVQRL